MERSIHTWGRSAAAYPDIHSYEYFLGISRRPAPRAPSPRSLIWKCLDRGALSMPMHTCLTLLMIDPRLEVAIWEPSVEAQPTAMSMEYSVLQASYSYSLA